jgi:hypothetical protein
MMRCTHCGHVSRCPQCTGWVCEACGAPLDGAAQPLPLQETTCRHDADDPIQAVRWLLVEIGCLCSEYSRHELPVSTRELAWRQQKIVDKALMIVRGMLVGER